MIHTLTIGHLDPAAVGERRVVVTRPLDMGTVTRLLREYGEADAAGRPTISGRPVEIHDGYLVCPWLMTRPVPGVAEFALRLQEETGCVLADMTRCAVIDRERLLAESRWERGPGPGNGGETSSGSRGR
jgi:hypothetical protein